MARVATSRRRPLHWFTPTLLPGGREHDRQCIVLDSYDGWHFRHLGAHDPELRVQLAADQELQRVAFDLYGLLYKPEPRRRPTSNHEFSAALLAQVEAACDLRRIRTQTVLSEWASVMALRQLIAPLARMLNEAQLALRSANTSQKVEQGLQRGDAAPGDVIRAAVEGFTGAQRFLASRSDAIHEAERRAAMQHDGMAGALRRFDLQHGLDRLRPLEWPSGGQPRGGQRGQIPPVRLAGVPEALEVERRELVEAMLAAAETLDDIRQARRALRDQATEQVRSGQDSALRKAYESAGKDLSTLMRSLEALLHLAQESDSWGREAGQGQPCDLDTILRLGKVLQDNPSVRALIEIVGRWTETLKRTVPRGKSPRGRSELVGVTRGDEIDRLLASEIVLLRQPRLRTYLLSRILERQALVWELRGPQLLGKGPVILVVDTSGSMGGDRVNFAMGLELALAVQCQAKRRPLHVLTFGARGEIREQAFPAKEDIWERLERCLSWAFGGGTDFDGPLLRVAELVGQAEWSQADVVMVTDGECNVRPDTMARLQRVQRATDLDLIGVLVGNGRGLDGVATVTYAVDPRLASAATSAGELECLLQRVGGRL